MKNIIKVVSFAGVTVLSSASASSLDSINPYDAIMDDGPVAERSTTEVLTDCASYAVNGTGTRAGLRLSSRGALATIGVAGIASLLTLAQAVPKRVRNACRASCRDSPQIHECIRSCITRWHDNL